MKETIEQQKLTSHLEQNLSDVESGRLEQKIVDYAYQTLYDYRNAITLEMQSSDDMPEIQKNRCIEAEKILMEMSEAIADLARKFHIPEKNLTIN